SRRRHTRSKRDWSSDVCSSDLMSMSYLGINFLPMVWGFMAMAVELVGALFVVLGLWTRPASLLLTLTMVVAYIYHTSAGDGWGRSEERRVGKGCGAGWRTEGVG